VYAESAINHKMSLQQIKTKKDLLDSIIAACPSLSRKEARVATESILSLFAYSIEYGEDFSSDIISFKADSNPNTGRKIAKMRVTQTKEDNQ
jgi:hypothetical protein